MRLMPHRMMSIIRTILTQRAQEYPILERHPSDFQRLKQLRNLLAIGLRVAGGTAGRELRGRVVGDAGGGAVDDGFAGVVGLLLGGGDGVVGGDGHRV